MAARWRGKDGDLHAGNSDFLASNTPNESALSRRDVEGVEMDTRSCMDHSILAIFEDSTVASESGVEEESATLLSALTEMLDSVEDDNGTPFDTLPDTKLLTHPEHRDNSVEPSLADRCRPRSKSPNVTFTIKVGGEKEDKSKIERRSPPQLFKQQSQTLFHSKNKKAEAEVEVFTSTSLVNLVKLMHPYCLKLHVEEEGDKLRRKHTLFSQEEVWKYERPTEECDEEINVVSDDEVTVTETKEEEEGHEKSADCKILKSVLLNGTSSRAPPSREKKRVSFGLIQVARGLNQKNLTSGHTSETVLVPEALEKPAGSAPERQTPSSEGSSNETEVLPPKGETKAKSLSLQQYRQLRQKRQPLVEKQRNYTTKWPRVSEPPKELTPILCLQGQSCGPKTAHHYPDGRRSGADQLHRSQTPGYKTHQTSAPPRPHPPEANPSTHLRRSGLKRPRTESKISSHASPLLDVTANTDVIVLEDAPIPVKETLSEVPPSKSPPEEPAPTLEFGCAAADSGIEAPDLTSLLEQNLPHLQMSESVDIPEPFGTDIILSTQQELPARRKIPPSKAIQIIDPRPLPSKKAHANLSEFPAAHTSAHMYSSITSDHDYCGPVDRLLTGATQRNRASKLKDFSKSTDELQVTTHGSSAAAECNKQTSIGEVSTTMMAVNTSAKSVMQARTRSETNPSTDKVLSLSDSTATEQRDCSGAAEHQTAPCALPTPPPSPPTRGREKRRYRRRSPRSDSSSSSFSNSLSPSSSSSSSSPSPKRRKHCHKRSESSSCSSSSSRSISRSPPRRYRWSYSRSRCSRSRSRSWSQSRSPSRSRSPSPRICRRKWRDVYRSVNIGTYSESRKLRREHEMRIQKLKAIDERRVVYVGRICRSMTHDELRERFTQFGEVDCVSLHFREGGDHYGFVTFYNMEDAFAAIDNGSKLRKPDELPFDICFGGRRQFCNSHYADLDANRDADADPSPAKSRVEDLDFDSLLKQAQRGLKR
ncbi:peroxisome proliferator-activated receptor gamma coactivator-related protein 1 [Enoplosus armatus]|uniref:peroxisome proliferator-activated receptor gamma coactivator-related protein 1 n=1 Tax=Enoplosus armatus TaxID=215367 RepID=UPI0039930AF4